MRALSRALALAPLLVVVSACGMTTPNGESCLPGDFEPIILADGGAGFLECIPDGSTYALYSGPNPNALPDASDADASVCGANGAPLGYFCSCTTDTECASGLDCISFVNKVGGSICTPACNSGNANMLCVPPSAGCGNNGHCKPE